MRVLAAAADRWDRPGDFDRRIEILTLSGLLVKMHQRLGGHPPKRRGLARLVLIEVVFHVIIAELPGRLKIR